MTTHEDIAARRAEATRAVVASEASKKLIVAGPGTGKTFTFRAALEACGERGLALTFIRNLVVDLQADLHDVADVFTFHGFCHHHMRRNSTDGLERGWHYYPLLLELLARDLALIGRPWTKRDLEHALHTLDHSGAHIEEVMRLGDYYNAVSHTDVVYRVLQHFSQYPDDLPAAPLIVVDEYQDFSEMETELIHLLATQSDVLIAGDDDQALYGFKGADPVFIRALANGGAFERFTLPYCSRCTDVIVKAVADVLKRATASGNLQGRLEKEFACYTPDKAADSEKYPQIVHATCSVQNKKAPYIGRYIVEQIERIPHTDVSESAAKRYPTVLVIGPQPFLGAAFDTIREAFPQTEFRKAEPDDVEILAGYRMIAADERSRLGWRIVIECDPFPASEGVIREVSRDEAELFELLPPEYRDRHLAAVGLVQQVLERAELDYDDWAALEAALDLSRPLIVEALLGTDVTDPVDKANRTEPAGGDGTVDEGVPTIVCTSLTGSKGLSAAHVFIVGFNDGHFPRNPRAITDTEICKFLVGLSRTRKSCHLVSTRHYGTAWLKPSAFATWIRPHLRAVNVDKAYFAK